MRIGRSYSFDAAHHLPNHNGKCRNLHGHTYRVEVELEGEVKPADGAPDEGMVIDFVTLDSAMEGIISRVDHTDLNDSPVFQPPTAENICSWVVIELIGAVGKDMLGRVRLYETERSWVEAVLTPHTRLS